MIVLGWSLVALGALVTVLMVAGMIVDPDDIAASVAALFLFGNIPLVAGALFVRAGRSRRRRRMMESTERLLLHIARRNRGSVTASLVAMETPLSIEEARDVLELFVTRGVVEMIVDDNGVVIYHFRELTAER